MRVCLCRLLDLRTHQPPGLPSLSRSAALRQSCWHICGTQLCEKLGIQHKHYCIVQVTSLVTPTLSSLAGDRPGRLVWLGCGVAMAGTVLLTVDHAPSAASSGLQQAAIGTNASLSASLEDARGIFFLLCCACESFLPLRTGTLILHSSSQVVGVCLDFMQN